jgi:hypothetical protein
MMKPYTLYLDDIDHLFNTPDFNPRSAHPRERSGLDALILKLQLQNQPYPDALIIYLPPEQITPDILELTRGAIQRYATMKIDEGGEELVRLRRSGLRGLAYGTAFLMVCLFIAYLGQVAPGLSPALSGFIYNGFTIIGWVSLWHPTEGLLFDWFEPWRDRRLYRVIELMEIEIKPA